MTYPNSWHHAVVRHNEYVSNLENCCLTVQQNKHHHCHNMSELPFLCLPSGRRAADPHRPHPLFSDTVKPQQQPDRPAPTTACPPVGQSWFPTTAPRYLQVWGGDTVSARTQSTTELYLAQSNHVTHALWRGRPEPGGHLWQQTIPVWEFLCMSIKVSRLSGIDHKEHWIIAASKQGFTSMQRQGKGREYRRMALFTGSSFFI